MKDDIRVQVAREIYTAIEPYVTSACDKGDGNCKTCEAKEICWAAVELKQEAEKILRESEAKANGHA